MPAPSASADLARAAQRLVVESRIARWCPHKPTEKQLDAMLCDSFELFFGGAMAGGKSDWELMDAAQWVHIPGYQALILRRSVAEANRMGAIFDRAQRWWIGKPGVHFDSDKKTFTFNGKGRITFGYLDKIGDEKRFDGTEVQRVYFDEIQDFEWPQYAYLFQRVRSAEEEGKQAPWAVRSAGMPGGVGDEWVIDRFIEHAAEDASKPWTVGASATAFIPSLVGDNPHLSKDYQEKSLANLDPYTREARGRGNWRARPEGMMFRREMFAIVERMPSLYTQSVRFWDFASSEKTTGKTPDLTASVKMHAHGRVIYISDCTEGWLSPNDGQDLMRTLAEADGHACAVRWEEELGASGAQFSAAIKRHILPEFNAAGVRVSGDKLTRAKPISKAADQRRIFLVRGAWNETFLSRMCAFPIGKRDVTDACSGAFSYLEEHAIGAPVVHYDDGNDRRTVTSKVRRMYGLAPRVR